MKKTISISRSIRMVPLLFVILFAAATLVDSEPCPPEGDISPCVCHGEPYITRVVCSNITIKDLHKFIFRGNLFQGPLRRLVLQNLPFSTLPFIGRYHLRVRHLEILDSNISHFTRDAIGAQPLLALRIDRNRLADVPSEALEAVSSRLMILVMSGNVLTKLGPTSLSFMLRIQKLRLSENEISEIARDSLPPNVKHLLISRNNLTTFNRSLHHTKKLQHLDASNNRLTSMKGEFDGVFLLEVVILDHNNISDISGTFWHLPYLRELSLVGNGIREVGEALVYLRRLTHLNLAHNKITNLNRTVFEKMKYLFDLNLSQNPLTAFQICPTLKILMPLRIVNFSNTNLEALPWNCFDNNTNLETVDLSRNQISTLGLRYASKLVLLDISFNNFQSVGHLDLNMVGSAKLKLEDNPWRCSMETTFILNVLDERGYYFPNGYPTCFPNDSQRMF